MSRDETRHAHRDENRNDTQQDYAEEKAVGSSGLGREAKIGVMVIALLLVAFGGVVAWRMLGAGSDDTVAATTEAGKEKPVGESKTETLLKDTKPKLLSANTATVVPAKSASSKAPKVGGNETDPWKIASDGDNRARGGSHGSSPSSPPSFMPDPPKPPHANRRERYSMDPPSGEDRDSSQVKPLREGENNVQLVAPGDEPPARFTHRGRDESSGFASVDAAPAPTRYRDQDDGRLDNASTTPLHSNARRATSADRFAPAAPVGQYGAGDYRRESVSPRGQNVEQRRSTAAVRSPAPQRNDGKYEVQPNDSYWTISEQMYGSGAYFNALAEHNRAKGKSEDQLQPGDLILAPAVADLEKSYPDLCPKPSRREALQSQSLASTVSTHRTGRTYTVAEGDTLFNIARYELGKASRWAEIYELNRDILGKDFNYLAPGTQLAMPSGETSEVIAQPPSHTYRR